MPVKLTPHVSIEERGENIIHQKLGAIMAVLRFPEEKLIYENELEIRAELAAIGIEYERWSLDRVGTDASAEDVLTAYAKEIDEMKTRGGYVTADVIDVNPSTPNLDVMLAKFDKEHTHSEDEVRFILVGRGIFFLHLGDKVASVEVGPGDMLRVPRGTTHWFTLCEDRLIRAIRWFQDTTGWTPEYTGSGIDQGYQPLCFGPAYFGPRATTGIRL
jgi:1,2-dihydroxy-3-keto-5-methylthiopentene dioxygenase